jgi:hypothetical protein
MSQGRSLVQLCVPAVYFLVGMVCMISAISGSDHMADNAMATFIWHDLPFCSVDKPVVRGARRSEFCPRKRLCRPEGNGCLLASRPVRAQATSGAIFS